MPLINMILTNNTEKVLNQIRYQYTDEFFRKLRFTFQKNKKILDVGCGEARDGLFLKEKFQLKYFGIDIYKDKNIKKFKINFKKAGIYSIPYPDNSFDYVFLRDVLHHIDEDKKNKRNLDKGFLELRRVCKKNGSIIICEGNRYNPIFYFHLVKRLGHDHFTHQHFKNIISRSFSKDSVSFSSFEQHAYPPQFKYLYELVITMVEYFSPKRFLAYNIAIITKK